jgi:hypothetical protein
MSTFTQLQAKVNRRVIDIPAAIEAETPDLVNQAMRELQVRHNFMVMEAEVSATTNVASSPKNLLVAKPSDWKEADGRPQLRRQWSRSKLLDYQASRKLAEMRYGIDDELSLGEPCGLLLDKPTDINFSQSFYVFPYPDGNSDWDDGEYRVIIPYFKFLPVLSASSDTNWFCRDASATERYITARATGEAFLLNQDEQRALTWLERAKTHLQEAREEDANMRLQGIDALIPHDGSNG